MPNILFNSYIFRGRLIEQTYADVRGCNAKHMLPHTQHWSSKVLYLVRMISATPNKSKLHS